MKLTHIIATLLLAGAMAALISVYLEPKSNTMASEAVDQAAAPNVASLAVDTPTAESTARRTTTISIRPDGHYWTRALVNKKASVEFMVDTGASVVALTYQDAQKMGLRPDSREVAVIESVKVMKKMNSLTDNTITILTPVCSLVCQVHLNYDVEEGEVFSVKLR